jgi:hypothetical protein
VLDVFMEGNGGSAYLDQAKQHGLPALYATDVQSQEEHLNDSIARFRSTHLRARLSQGIVLGSTGPSQDGIA